jgi:nucleoside diphosphate kinase
MGTEELTYLLITPYSLHKGRTGGILSRVLSQTYLNLIHVRMYAFTAELAEQFAATIEEMDLESPLKEAFVEYCRTNLSPNSPLGISNRCLVLFFRGPDAVRHLKDDVVGSITRVPLGDRVRRTYGDYIVDPDGKVRWFEPAVICAADPEVNRKQLALLDQYAETDGGVVEHAVKFPPEELPRVQTTLVVLKPENFARPSRLPGNIVDVFSTTGCYIVGAKLVNMSIHQALEFYAPLEERFRDTLRDKVREAVAKALGSAFSFPIPDPIIQELTEKLRGLSAQHELYRIVEYMTGLNPLRVTSPEARMQPGNTRCLALLYRGPNAVQVIRQWLGSTDPMKAEPGTVRSDFGRDLMRNGAHASDSVEAAERERRILGLWDKQDAEDLHRAVQEYLGQAAAAVA